MPSATTYFKFFNNAISCLKKPKQLLNSFFSGLSSGGTHFSAVVINASLSFNPSLTCSELFWLDICALNKHLYKNSEDLSPVNTLPVLVAPCAAGANPTNKILPSTSPNPVIGRPQ